jgi:carbamoyl-phosphate synthase large subunit
VPHRRLEVRAGEVVKAVTEAHAELQRLASRIQAAVPGLRGPWCFQAIERPDGRLAVFEINARFGGGYPVTHASGAHFTTRLLAEALGLPLPSIGPWRPGTLMLRYDAAVFGALPGTL